MSRKTKAVVEDEAPLEYEDLGDPKPIGSVEDVEVTLDRHGHIKIDFRPYGVKIPHGAIGLLARGIPEATLGEILRRSRNEVGDSK